MIEAFWQENNLEQALRCNMKFRNDGIIGINDNQNITISKRLILSW